MGLTRYFKQYQKGIEYQAADMPNLNQAQTSWLQKYQLISPAFFASLEKIESDPLACSSTQTFISKINSKQHIHLVWDAKHQLPISLSATKNKQKITWQRIKLNTNSQQVRRLLNHYENYQLTDYADIGYNEADPFLAKMINQGFIKHEHSTLYHTDNEAM